MLGDENGSSTLKHGEVISYKDAFSTISSWGIHVFSGHENLGICVFPDHFKEYTQGKSEWLSRLHVYGFL